MEKTTESMHRIAIIGVSGSGKTTLAKKLSRHYKLPHIELDTFLFNKDETKRDTESFRKLVAEQVSRLQWIAEGVSYKMADLVWTEADFVVWLDPPYRTIKRRVVMRSLSRWIRRSSMPSGHKVTFSSGFGKQGIARVIHKIYAEIHKQYPKAFNRLGLDNINLVHIKSTRELRDWLAKEGIK